MSLASATTPYVQRSLDDLGTPLSEVTFCVIDLETTGSDRHADRITEIGAIKLRAGEVVGTFSTLVHPEMRIPPQITVLTGITDAMVGSAPRLDAVLPSLAEFVGGTVIVGHNVRFDVSFLNAALDRCGAAPLANVIVDTLALARRLVRDEVPDCRLGTLAARFRLDHRPTHRAFDDALATTDLLHLLLERAASWGVLGLDDLLALPRLGGHPQAAKLSLTNKLPRSSGVYLFRDARGEVLYVGKASNLRARVRSYFGSDDRRKIGPMLRETASITVETTPDVLVAEVLEARLIRTLMPRYNRAGTGWARYCYVRLSTNEAWPRLTIVNRPGPGWLLGPLPSRAAAGLVIDAIQTMFPLRRCTARLGPRFRPANNAGACTAHQLGLAHCPCSGSADAAEYAAVVRATIDTVTQRPQALIDHLSRRMATLAGQRRFEEAAATRDRMVAFANAVDRSRRVDDLRRAGYLEVRIGGLRLDVAHGVLRSFSVDGRLAEVLPVEPPPDTEVGQPVDKAAIDEILLLARALDRRAAQVTLGASSGGWASPLPPVIVPTRLAASVIFDGSALEAGRRCLHPFVS